MPDDAPKGLLDEANKLVTLIAAVIGVIGAGIGVWYTVHPKPDIKPAQIATATPAPDHHAQTMELYNAVSAAVKSGSSQQESLALGLVESYQFTDQEQNLKSAMLAILSSAASPEVRSKAANAQFQLQDSNPNIGVAKAVISRSPASVAAKPLGNFSVDVFWCEGSATAAKKAADDVAALLAPDTNGRVRSRVLPLSKREGSYKVIAAAEVRREDTSAERPIADTLRSLTGQKLVDDGIVSAPDKLGVRSVGTPTPNYVSMFICPPAA